MFVYLPVYVWHHMLWSNQALHTNHAPRAELEPYSHNELCTHHVLLAHHPLRAHHATNAVSSEKMTTASFFSLILLSKILHRANLSEDINGLSRCLLKWLEGWVFFHQALHHPQAGVKRPVERTNVDSALLHNVPDGLHHVSCPHSGLRGSLVGLHSPSCRCSVQLTGGHTWRSQLETWAGSTTIAALRSFIFRLTAAKLVLFWDQRCIICTAVEMSGYIRQWVKLGISGWTAKEVNSNDRIL